MRRVFYKFFGLIFIFLAVCYAFNGNVFLLKNIEVVSAQSDSNFTNLIVFVRFSDEDDYINASCDGKATVGQITENCYTLADYSVKDYYFRVSNGKVKMQNLYLFGENDESLQLSNPRGYYCINDETNSLGYNSTDKTERANRMLALQQDWSSAINSALSSGCTITNFDKTETYPASSLDKNGDGYIDSLTIIYNYSTKHTINSGDCLWNYQYTCDMVEIPSNGKTIKSGNYLQLTANYSELYKDKNGVYFSNLQTMIHEMGHIFKLKDLYKSNMSSPVYFMSAMAKAISPIPQYISAKEREVLGWLDKNTISQIETAGTYTVGVTSSEIENQIISYKISIPSTNKTLYLEYRRFEGEKNKYDSQTKNFKYADDTAYTASNNLKSGLVCFLFKNGTKYPDNLSSETSNYEVFGGGGTKNDSALETGESYSITSGLKIEVISMNTNSLSFSVVGTDMEHIHSITHVPKKSATCVEVGNDEYWMCDLCGKYFDDENLIWEKQLSEFIINKKPHNKQWYDEEPPTCKKEGVGSGNKCSVCGLVYDGCQPIPKLDHVSSDWITDTDSTETELGEKHKECVNCGEILETGTIVLKPPTDEKDDSKDESETPPDSGEDDPIDTPDPPQDETAPPQDDDLSNNTNLNNENKHKNNKSLKRACIISGSLGIAFLILFLFIKIKKRKYY